MIRHMLSAAALAALPLTASADAHGDMEQMYMEILEGWQAGGVDTATWSESALPSDLYAMFDTDGDGSLTEQEFAEGLFRGYDDDMSGVIEAAEFDPIDADFRSDGRYGANRMSATSN